MSAAPTAVSDVVPRAHPDTSRSARELIAVLRHGRCKSLASVLLKSSAEWARFLSRSHLRPSLVGATSFLAIVPFVVGLSLACWSPGFSQVNFMFLSWVALCGSTMLLSSRFYGRALLQSLILDIIPNLGTAADIADLESWLTHTYSIRRQFLFSLLTAIVGCVGCAIYAGLTERSDQLGVGPLFILFVGWFEAGTAWYFTFPGMRLPQRLANYDLITQTDRVPGSMFVASLEHLLQRCLLVSATVATVLTAGVSWFSGLGNKESLFFSSAAWIPLVLVFAHYQFWIKRLTMRINGRLLESIYGKMRVIYERADAMSKEDASRLKELGEVADRLQVDASRTRTELVQPIMGLIQALALPLLPPAFIPILKGLLGVGDH